MPGLWPRNNHYVCQYLRIDAGMVGAGPKFMTSQFQSKYSITELPRPVGHLCAMWYYFPITHALDCGVHQTHISSRFWNRLFQLLFSFWSSTFCEDYEQILSSILWYITIIKVSKSRGIFIEVVLQLIMIGCPITFNTGLHLFILVYTRRHGLVIHFRPFGSGLEWLIGISCSL